VALDAFDDAEEGRPALAGLGLPTTDLLRPGLRQGVDSGGSCFLLLPASFLLDRIELPDYPPDLGNRSPSPASNLGYRASFGPELADLVRWNIFTACSGRGDMDREQTCN
jgi:hypothetical protein